MIEEGIKCCPFCGSQNIVFSAKRKSFFCEGCEKAFDKPVSENVEGDNDSKIDVR